MMRKLLTCLLLLSPALTLAQQRPAAGRQPLVFTRVTVIDATGAPAKPGMTVVITGDRITEIGKPGKVRIPAGAQVVDATSKFLIPGLWDMHIHWYDKQYLPLFTANGVTGARQMFGAPFHLQWRKEAADGTLAGPRMVVASPIVDGPKPIWPGSVAVGNEAEGQQAVSKAKAAGADFVKVYSLLPRDAFFAIASEARKQGIPFAGHVPSAVSAAEASDTGQKSIEHLTGVLMSCSSREEALRKEFTDAMANPDARDKVMAVSRAQSQQLLDTYDGKKAAALFARFAKNGTWQCPTLTVLRSMAYLDDATVTNDPRLKFMPPSIRNSWNPKRDFRLAARTAEDYANAKKTFQKHLEIVGAMRRAGVEFIAGTDVLNPYCFPGFSLHDELALLVKAGLTPMEALQAATRNPARFLGVPDSLGTVEKGKIADLVLLDANPLADIGNTQKIRAVVTNGRLLERQALDEMLAQVEALANKK